MTDLQHKMFYAIILIVITIVLTIVYIKAGLETAVMASLILLLTNQIVESNLKQ